MPIQDDYFVTGRGSLANRDAGTSAREAAKQELAKAPIRSRLARILRVHTDERAWRVGADGEERMGRLLARLPRGWFVFHDLPIGAAGANIDHLVIGPGGVFTVNTKNLTGRVWVGERALLHNGNKTDYLRKALAEAKRASAILSRAGGRPIATAPVLALFCEALTIKSDPRDVHVIRASRLVAWLRSRSIELQAADCFAIARTADNPATWRS